jgi:hypothetical protein
LFPEDIFEKLFERVLAMCVSKGMVAGHTQAIDSAPVKANASMDSLELKVPEEDLDEHLRKVRYMSTPDRTRKAKNNKADESQQTITASEQELTELKSRNKKWCSDQDERPGSKNKNAKYTSNKTHYSPTDPDARISVKPGKARKLNFHAQMAVDTAYHVITSMQADFADKHDSRSLVGIVDPLVRRLKKQGLKVESILADAGYSSGENYADMEARNLPAYLPPQGPYKGGPDTFNYQKDGDYYVCPNGKRAVFRKTKTESGTLKNFYATKTADCRGCPLKLDCLGKLSQKRFSVIYHREEYERAITRLKSTRGRYMKGRRQATVEPVFGVLTQYLAMRKVMTKGIHNANKQFKMAAIAYNLKKYLKFDLRKVQTQAKEAYGHVASIILPVYQMRVAQPSHFLSSCSTY